MPRVPTYQPGQAGPVQTTSQRFRAPSNPGGLGVLAEGLAGASRVLGEEVQRRAETQALADETEGRQATMAFLEAAAPIMAEAKLARGANVSEAFSTAQAALQKERDRLVSGATNRQVREAVTLNINAYLSDYNSQLSQQQAVETRAAALDTMQAQAGLSRDESVRAVHNPTLAQKHLDTGRAIIERRSAMMGRTGDLLQQDVRDYTSGTHRAVFGALVAEGDMDMAIAYQEAHENDFTAEDATAISATLRSIKLNRQAYADGAAALGQGVATQDLPTGGKYAMPVAAGRVTSAFGAHRGATSHNGVDWAAPQGSDVRPMAGGQVVRVDSDGRSGKFVVIDHGDGTTTSYSHLGRQDVKVGDTVNASTVLGVVGMTGDTTGPHVHVVARQHGKAVDPVSLLGKSGSSGSGREGRKVMDQRAARAWIDKQPWSFERKQAAYANVENQIGEQDQIQAREERQADRQASEMVLRLGDRFTSVSQLGNLINTMSVGAVQTYTNVAAQNSKPREVAANGEAFLRISRIAQQFPEQFARMNLGEIVGKVTPSELVRLSDDQGRIIRKGSEDVNAGEVNIRSQIEGTMTSFVPFTLSKADKIRVHDSMASYLRALTAGKRQPTSAELRDALNVSIRTITIEKPGVVWGTNRVEKRAFDTEIGDVPEREKNLAREALRRAGQEATDDAIVSLYLQKMARQQATGR